MTETLWVTLPNNEEKALKNVINLIYSKNLINLSVKQLIEKLENNHAADWIDVFNQYNAIPSINNMNSSEMLSRTRSVANKFRQRGYDQLENREFSSNELLSLVILCYSNPNLIGPKLCKALNDSNDADIKKEILENSARVGNRVAPWASNLRLANYALYANDTSVRLPVAVINRVKNETIQNGRTVHLVDQRGGFDEWVNNTERAARGIRSPNYETKLDSYQILQSLQLIDHIGVSHPQLDSPVSTSHMSYSGNGSELSPEVLSLNARNNAVNSSYGNVLVIGTVALFQVARNTPVGAIVRNISKDLASAGKHVGSIFTKNNSEHMEQQEQKPLLLSSTAKP